MSYSFNGKEVRDLVANNAAGFAVEAASWTASKYVTSSVITSNCGGTLLLGGYKVLGGTQNEYFQRTYSGLPSHNVIYFSATLSILDGWASDALKIVLDGATLDRITFNKADFPANKCGASGKDLVDVYVMGRIPHTKSSVVLQVVSDMKKTSDTASFGIRDVSLLFANAASNCLMTGACIRSASVPALSPEQACPCAKGTFTNDGSFSLAPWVGYFQPPKCTACNKNCASCFGPSASECYQCASGSYFDGTSCVPCDSSCGTCTGAGADKCITCAPGYFKDDQGNCLLKCDPPLIQGTNAAGEKTCTSKCPGSSYVFPDGSCSSKCLPPMIIQNVGCMKLCVNPCQGKYINWNGVCQDKCELPFRIRTVQGVSYCDKPCDSPLYYWAEGNTKCVSQCEDGWTTGTNAYGVDICKLQCTGATPVWSVELKKCVPNCPPGWQTVLQSGRPTCVNPCCPKAIQINADGTVVGCVDPCPAGWMTQLDAFGAPTCIPKCKAPNGFYYPVQDDCRCDCPVGTTQGTTNGVPSCNPICRDCDYFWAEADADGECVSDCPAGWTGYQNSDGLGRCKLTCTGDKPIWSDELKACVAQCPTGWQVIVDHTLQKCFNPCAPKAIWIQDGKVTCVNDCPPGWIKSTDKCGAPICVHKCTGDFDLYYPVQDTCKCECPAGTHEGTTNGVPSCIPDCQDNESYWPQGEDQCVTNCEDGWTSVVNADGLKQCTLVCTGATPVWSVELKKCVPNCPPGWHTEIQNGRPTCVNPCCPKAIQINADGTVVGCVDPCPAGWMTQLDAFGAPTCVPKCKAPNGFYYPVQDTCRCDCPAGTTQGTTNGIPSCNPICQATENYWAEGSTHCVSDCPDGWMEYMSIDGILKCKLVCTGTEPIWAPAKPGCVAQCPPGWQTVTENGAQKCKKLCPDSTVFYYQGSPDKCPKVCPAGWEQSKDQWGADVCVEKCTGTNNIWYVEHDVCVCDCPSGWSVDIINFIKYCRKPCECPLYYWGKTCVKDCPEGLMPGKNSDDVDVCVPKCTGVNNVWYPIQQNCRCDCPAGTIPSTLNGVPSCSPICPNNYFWGEGEPKCVNTCPEGWTGFTNSDGIKQCKLTCTDGTPIWSSEKKKCVAACPTGWNVITEFTRKKCVWPCKPTQNIWIHTNGKPNECVDKCPAGWVPSNDDCGGSVCVPKCTGTNGQYFPLKDTCVATCPVGTTSTVINEVKTCKNNCDSGYWWNEANKCVSPCTDGWTGATSADGINICKLQCSGATPIWSAELKKCVAGCPPGWNVITELTRKKCIWPCKPHQDLWIHNWGKNKDCVDKCPDGWVSKDDECGGGICTPKCTDPKDNVFYPPWGTCGCDCPDGTTQTIVNEVGMCKLFCPNNYLWAENNNKCVDTCTDGWKGITNAAGLKVCTLTCTDGTPIWYRENKACVKTCPSGWSVVIENGRKRCVQNGYY